MNKYNGTGVALVTPFSKDEKIDFAALEKVIDFTISNRVDYLVTLGTTGESVTLTKEEKNEVLDFTIDKVNGRVPLVAGFGGNNTKELISGIESFHFKGIDAILSVSPYYNKPTQQGILEHYKAIAETSPVPVILYNVPARTASNINAETTLRLANESENIIGIKEASGDFNQIMTLIQHKPDNFFVVSGDDAITLPMLAAGATGVISVIANALPAQFSDMVRLALDNQIQEAQKLHYKLFNIMGLLFKEGNPAGVKCALELQNICGEHVRLPLVPASEKLREQLLLSMELLKEVETSF